MGIYSYQTNAVKNDKQKVSYLMDVTVEHLKQDLNKYVEAASVWSKSVNSTEDVSGVHFLSLARSIYDNDVNVESVVLAPVNESPLIYPLSVYRIDREIEGYLSTMELSQIYVQLDNEKRFIQIYAPVYSGDYQERKYWGYIVLTVKCPNIFNDTYLMYLEENGFSYNLSYYYGNMQSHITASPVEVTKNALIRRFNVCNSNWSFSIQPEKGWLDKKILIIQILATLFVSFCVAQLAWIISFLNEKNKTMERLSYEDSLTQVSNGRKFEQVKEFLRKSNDQYAIYYIDMNYFKVLNDTMGHDVGDKLLQVIARRLVNSVKLSDWVFRVGGDEFVVLINGLNTAETYKLIKQRLEKNISASINLGDRTLCPDVSVGYAVFPDDGSSIDEVVRKAERYMYAQKAEKKVDR